MGSIDCPTFAQCEAAWNSPNYVKGTGPATCTFFEKAADGSGQDGWECTDGTKCTNGLDKDGFFCNNCVAHGQLSPQQSCAEHTVLLEEAQAEDESNYSGAIVGTSVAVLGAAAAFFAVRRCKKDGDHFERQ